MNLEEEKKQAFDNFAISCALACTPIDEYKIPFECGFDAGISKITDFADWLHNNWYEPEGSDGFWRLKAEDEEYTLPIPNVNFFTSEELAAKYISGEGAS